MSMHIVVIGPLYSSILQVLQNALEQSYLPVSSACQYASETTVSLLLAQEDTEEMEVPVWNEADQV